MSLDFQQVKQQVTAMGETALQRLQLLREKRQKAVGILQDYASNLHELQTKIELAIQANQNLRCAFPKNENLNFQGALPLMPKTVALLAADGSQINPGQQSSVDYCLVNVGAIQMTYGQTAPPVTKVETKLYFDDQMYTSSGRITERLVALMRDLSERELLAAMAQEVEPPIITLTDGPLELWGGRDGDMNQSEFNKHFDKYLDALTKLKQSGASTAGYIDHPRSDLLVRTLEIATLPKDEIDKAGRSYRPFLGVRDVDLFNNLLGPCERSAIFGIQSSSRDKYKDSLELHFFYLNVGRDDEHPYLVRVEVPAWVANNEPMVDDLQAVLVQQCRVLGAKPYPYLIHRSHEIAVVTMDEKKQVENMIDLEMHRRDVYIEGSSHKQLTKDLPGRTRL